MARKYTPLKCHCCGEKIEKQEDLVKANITEKQVKNFHKDCYPKFLEAKELKDKEYKEWCDLYDYVQLEIMGYTKEKKLTPIQRRTLQNLRNGDFLSKGDKVSTDGYSYPTILTTFKAKKLDIERATYNKTFEDDNHRFNYLMSIIKNSINDIARKLEQAKKDREKEGELIHIIKDVDVKDTFAEYKKAQEKKTTPKTKVSDLLSGLL